MVSRVVSCASDVPAVQILLQHTVYKQQTCSRLVSGDLQGRQTDRQVRQGNWKPVDESCQDLCCSWW